MPKNKVLTKEQAKQYFDQFHSVEELSDDELDTADMKDRMKNTPDSYCRRAQSIIYSHVERRKHFFTFMIIISF